MALAPTDHDVARAAFAAASDIKDGNNTCSWVHLQRICLPLFHPVGHDALFTNGRNPGIYASAL